MTTRTCWMRNKVRGLPSRLSIGMGASLAGGGRGSAAVENERGGGGVMPVLDWCDAWVRAPGFAGRETQPSGLSTHGPIRPATSPEASHEREG